MAQIERIALEDLIPADGMVVVPKALLELCLGVILDLEHRAKVKPGCFSDDIDLAVGQLRSAIAE